MKATPVGWPRISSALYYDDPARAIEWLCEAFGFEVRLCIEGEGGRVEHSELVFGDGLVMVGGTGPHSAHPELTQRATPSAVGGGNTQNLLVFVDDVDAHCARARACGARIVAEPKTVDHGADYWSDRIYEAEDPWGHHWWFTQRVRDPSPPSG
ncbi:MAG: VOC family protein [bacterium]